MDLFPNDIIRYIGYYLHINELNNFRCTCKKINQILNNNQIYKYLRDNNLIYEKNISIKLIDDNGNIYRKKTFVYYCLKCGQIEIDKNDLIFKCMHCDKCFCKNDLYHRGIINVLGSYIKNLNTNCYFSCKHCVIQPYDNNLYDYLYKYKDLIYITPYDYNRIIDEKEKKDWISAVLLK